MESIAQQIRYWEDRLSEWENELALWNGSIELPDMALTIFLLMEEIEQRIALLRTLLPM